MSELPNQEELNSLSMLVAEWDNNEENIIRTTNVLKMLNARKNTLEIDLIPALMATASNIEEFKLNDGRKITIKEELYASVTEAKKDEAFKWLEEHGHSAIIKNEMKLALGRGDDADERAKTIITLIEQMGISDYSVKRAVHEGTLKALLKEQLAEGVEIPKETFSVFQQRRALIKLPKGAK